MCCDDCIGCAGTSVQIIEMLVDLLLNVVTVARMDLPLELLMLICSARCVWSQLFSFNDRDRRSGVGYCFYDISVTVPCIDFPIQWRRSSVYAQLLSHLR